MTIKIEIPESHLSAFKDFYQTKYKEYLSRVNELQKEWAELEPIVTRLGIYAKTYTKSQSDHKPNVNGYNSKWPWREKAKYVLSKKGALTASQIGGILKNELEPDISITLLERSLPAILSQYTDKGFSRHKNEKNEWVYDVIK